MGHHLLLALPLLNGLVLSQVPEVWRGAVGAVEKSGGRTDSTLLSSHLALTSPGLT